MAGDSYLERIEMGDGYQAPTQRNSERRSGADLDNTAKFIGRGMEVVGMLERAARARHLAVISKLAYCGFRSKRGPPCGPPR